MAVAKKVFKALKPHIRIPIYSAASAILQPPLYLRCSPPLLRSPPPYPPHPTHGESRVRIFYWFLSASSASSASSAVSLLRRRSRPGGRSYRLVRESASVCVDLWVTP